MILAVDIGGTKLATALIDDGEIVERRTAPSPLHGNFVTIPSLIARLSADWIGRYTAIGIASAGLIEGQRVRLVSREGRPVLDLGAQIEALLGYRPTIVNDAWAGALGEYGRGEYRDAETLVYVTVSTGIGAGIVHKGQLLTSANGLMAHIGHMHGAQVTGTAQICHCGRTNCIEMIASGTGIERAASALHGSPISTREVFAREGTVPAFAELLDRSAAALAEVLVDARALLGADCFVMGGSVGLVPAFFERVRTDLATRHAPWATELRPAALGKDAELHGAALAALSHLNL